MRKLICGKWILLVIISLFFVPLLSEAEQYNQSITLKPGWNIISAPRIVDSHTFSAEEISSNFDIYILNPSSLSGWSTMADLGQSEFTPLFGYFINNKTLSNQILTINYKEDPLPGERLFERSFSTTGWYSIGPANPTYTKTVCSSSSDINNVSKILSSLSEKFSSVIDFTDPFTDSFAINNQWKLAVASEANNLNDLRELKGYAIYLNQTEALLSGFQNDDEPCIAPLPPPPTPATLNIFLASNPTSQTVVGGGWVDALGVVVSAGSASKVTVSSVTFQGYADGTLGGGDYTTTEFDETVSQVTLWAGATQLGTATSPDTNGVFTFSGFSREIASGQSETWTVKALPDTTLENADADLFYVDLIGDTTVAAQTTNMSVVDKDGNPINPTSTAWADEAGGVPTDTHLNDANAGAETEEVPSVILTVTGSGSLNVTLDGNTPYSMMQLANTTGNELSKYRMDSLNETFQVQTLSVANITTAGALAATDELVTVSLYVAQGAGTPALVVSGSTDANGIVRFSNGSGLFNVVPGTSVYITLKGDIASDGSGTSGADSGDNLRLALYMADDNAVQDFRAVGVSSSTALQEADAATNNTAPVIANLTYADNVANVDGDLDTTFIAGSDTIVRKSKPTVVSAATAGSLSNGDDTLLEYTISATGSDDVALKRFLFNYSETGTFTSSDFKFFEGGTDITSQVAIRAVGDFDANEALDLEQDIDSTAGDIGVTDGGAAVVSVTFTNEKTISSGSSKTFSLRSSVAGAGTGESITVSMRNDNTSFKNSSALGSYRNIQIYYQSTDSAFDGNGAEDTIFFDFNGNGAEDATDAIIDDAQIDNEAYTGIGELVSTTVRRLTGSCLLVVDAGDENNFVFDLNCDQADAAGEPTVTLAAEVYTGLDLMDLAPYAFKTAGDTVLYLDINDSSADDATEPTFVVAAGHTQNVSAGVVSNFAWSDSSADIHAEATADWANGFYVNAPASSLSNVKKTLSL